MWRGVGFIRQCKLMLVRFVRLRGLPEEIALGIVRGLIACRVTCSGAIVQDLAAAPLAAPVLAQRLEAPSPR